MSVTAINKANCDVLRKDINEALAKILSKHGLVGSIGRITYDPGVELRTKLVVSQPTPGVSTAKDPKVGEIWQLGNRKYTIVEVNGKEVIATRPVRGLPRRYRITEKNIQAMVRVK